MAVNYVCNGINAQNLIKSFAMSEYSVVTHFCGDINRLRLAAGGRYVAMALISVKCPFGTAHCLDAIAYNYGIIYLLIFGIDLYSER